MSSYPYDALLTTHFQKNAGFLAPLARTAWGGAKGLAGQALKSVPGFASQFSDNPAIQIGGSFMRGGQTGQMAGQFHAHASSGVSNTGPSLFGWTPGAKQGSTTGRYSYASDTSLSSPRENQAAATYRLKSANDDHTMLHHALHAAPYVAWLGSQAADATGHPTLSKALSAGAYLGYAGASAHDALTNPKEKVTGAIDALALTAMLGSDIARWRQAPSNPTP